MSFERKRLSAQEAFWDAFPNCDGNFTDEHVSKFYELLGGVHRIYACPFIYDDKILIIFHSRDTLFDEENRGKKIPAGMFKGHSINRKFQILNQEFRQLSAAIEAGLNI